MPQREGDHIRAGDHLVGTGTEARAGVTGHNVRYVLVLGNRWLHRAVCSRIPLCLRLAGQKVSPVSRVEPPPESPEPDEDEHFERPQMWFPTAQPMLAGFVIATIIGMITLAAFMYE